MLYFIHFIEVGTREHNSRKLENKLQTRSTRKDYSGYQLNLTNCSCVYHIKTSLYSIKKRLQNPDGYECTSSEPTNENPRNYTVKFYMLTSFAN